MSIARHESRHVGALPPRRTVSQVTRYGARRAHSDKRWAKNARATHELLGKEEWTPPMKVDTLLKKALDDVMKTRPDLFKKGGKA